MTSLDAVVLVEGDATVVGSPGAIIVVVFTRVKDIIFKEDDKHEKQLEQVMSMRRSWSSSCNSSHGSITTTAVNPPVLVSSYRESIR